MSTKDTTANPDELLRYMRFDAHWLNRDWRVVDGTVQTMATDDVLTLVKYAVQFAARFQRMDELCREGKPPTAWNAANGEEG